MAQPVDQADPSSAFTTKFLVRFHHADIGNTMFFGNIYAFAHEALERFVVHMGLDWREWFTNRAWAAPYRRIDAEHRRLHIPGTEVEVTVRVTGVDESSFASRYEFAGPDGALFTALECVNAFIDRRTMESVAIPDGVRARLERECERTKGEAS